MPEPDRVGVEALGHRFPPRPPGTSWPHTGQSRQEVLTRVDGPVFRAECRKTQVPRLRGTGKMLDWLATFPGDTWQQRWLASGQEQSPGTQWARLPTGWLTARGQSANPGILGSGLLMLICADVIRPSPAWLISRGSCTLAAGLAQYRDAEGFAALDRVITGDPAIINANAQPAKARIAVILASKGGRIADITVGDCVEFYGLHSRVRPQGAPGKTLFYVLLHRLGIFGADAPATLRALCGQARGQHPASELVDRYHLRTGPIRDLIIDYLTERRPSLDYSTLNRLALELAGLFWADLEHHHPGIATLHLPPEVATGWKERLKTKTRTVTDPHTGTQTTISSPRNSAAGVLSTVRAFYLDIAHWALEEPARWGPWAAPCPIKDTELSIKKEKQAVKARMDQRTRERLPVLPALRRTANELRKAAAERLTTAAQARPGDTVTAGGQTLRMPIMYRDTNAKVWAQDIATGLRRDLTLEEGDAFWVWAAIEVLSRRRDPDRGDAGADPPGHHVLPPATHGGTRAPAADRSLQDRRRTTAAGRPRARRCPIRDHLPHPHAPRGRSPRPRLRLRRENMDATHGTTVPAHRRRRETRLQPPGDLPDVRPDPDRQRTHRHRRKPSPFHTPRFPENLHHRRDYERSSAAHRPDHRRPCGHHDHDGLQGHLPDGST